MKDGARLARIRDLVAGIAPGEWTRVHDSEGCFIEARTKTGMLLPIARFDPGASEDEIAFVCDAAGSVQFLLELIDRAIAKTKALQPDRQGQPPAGPVADVRKNYAAEATMKCSEWRFLEFLAARHGLQEPLTTARGIQKLRSLLGINSRKELNMDDQAAARWKAMRGDFENWKRTGN
ncbi:hypothetical protein [Allomesorhizobium camelthorni]|uniref:Uncharacterized protein n=1 Tax=Allomesorhizobium camelthorni TaxID=475069 RepID=A0A6G4W8G6_9HYPH|nr:hypothetical protein [Mesorhizobium camelthorni]NGO50450.1 hypothetical protein [Mesorhizobium camelthorni]